MRRPRLQADCWPPTIKVYGMWRQARPARSRRSPPGFIAPCIPTLAKVAPSGPQWLHEIKHDGYRIIARKDRERVRLWSRYGLSWTAAFPFIVEALRAMPTDCVVLDGEASRMRGRAPRLPRAADGGGEERLPVWVRPSRLG